jgi:hypothetical protein
MRPRVGQPFDDPILLPGGRKLVTVRDAAAIFGFASAAVSLWSTSN